MKLLVRVFQTEDEVFGFQPYGLQGHSLLKARLTVGAGYFWDGGRDCE